MPLDDFNLLPAHLSPDKIVIGLVGQVCAGKSAVAEAFRQHGARVYDADKSVHEIYARADVIEQVVALFGAGVLNDAGQVDRKALAAIVFSDAAQLKRLTNEIVFPRTGRCNASGIGRVSGVGGIVRCFLMRRHFLKRAERIGVTTLCTSKRRWNDEKVGRKRGVGCRGNSRGAKEC